MNDWFVISDILLYLWFLQIVCSMLWSGAGYREYLFFFFKDENKRVTSKSGVALISKDARPVLDCMHREIYLFNKMGTVNP